MTWYEIQVLIFAHKKWCSPKDLWLLALEFQQIPLHIKISMYIIVNRRLVRAQRSLSFGTEMNTCIFVLYIPLEFISIFSIKQCSRYNNKIQMQKSSTIKHQVENKNMRIRQVEYKNLHHQVGFCIQNSYSLREKYKIFQ